MSDGSLARWLDRLLDGETLSEDEARALLYAIAQGDVPPAAAGGVLAALRTRGETAAEIRGFARGMRELARRPGFAERRGAVDIVGTGGDGSGSVNLSTGTALLVAACGVPVVKHGNRSVSSRCGSADVLEALGLPMPLDERRAAEALDELSFTFLFAPHYHPAMKQIAPVRRALGVRTIFNVLGPLTNPAAPPFHVLGAYSPDAARVMAEALSGLPIERGVVVHGAPGWDEATPVGEILVFDVVPGRVQQRRIDPAAWGVDRCRPEDLAGGDARDNARLLSDALAGRARGAVRDALVLGAAFALEVTGAAPDGPSGVALAAEAIDDGRAATLLERLRAFGARAHA